VSYRKTVNVPLLKAIETHVARNMNPDRARKVVKNCEALDEARRELVALKHWEDPHKYKKLLIFYYNGLRYLDSKFTFKHEDAEAVNIFFTWQDSYSGHEYVSTEGLELEMNSILYNLAAVMNNMASTSPITIDSIKYISMDFQSAGWIFDHMCSTLEALSQELRGIDFRFDNLKRLVALELAQSQYWFFKKAELSGMKPGLVSKLARHVWVYFIEAEGYVSGTLKLEYEKFWPYLIKLTSVYTQCYDAISHMYKAKEMLSTIKEDGSGAGILLGHLTVSSRILSSLKTVNEAVQQNIQTRLDESEVLREEATSMNDNIYHDTIIREKDLPKLESKNFAVLRSIEEEINENFSKRMSFDDSNKKVGFSV